MVNTGSSPGKAGPTSVRWDMQVLLSRKTASEQLNEGPQLTSCEYPQSKPLKTKCKNMD